MHVSQAKHAWILLAFLLAWAIEQVAWVSTDSQHEACYEIFDAKGLSSATSAVLASLVVVALAFGEHRNVAYMWWWQCCWLSSSWRDEALINSPEDRKGPHVVRVV